MSATNCLAQDFVSPDSSFIFKYNGDEFKVSEKMMGITLKTHDYEVLLKSLRTKGFTAGVTVCVSVQLSNLPLLVSVVHIFGPVLPAFFD